LDIEEDKIGRMFLDESEGFDAVLALADQMHLGKTLEEKREFVARGFLVVYDESVDRHDGCELGPGQYMRRGFCVQPGQKSFYTEGTESTEEDERREDGEIISSYLLGTTLEFQSRGRRNGRCKYLPAQAGATNDVQMEADLAKGRAKVLKSKVLYTGKVFRLQRDTVVEPGGVRAERDIVVHPGSVVVLPIFEDGRVLLIRQYRHTVGEFLWELVAGRKEPNESPAAGARRELLEETGYTARRLRKLLHIIPTPGFVNEWMWIFAAEGLVEGAAQPEEDEKITPRIFTLKQVDAMIQSGRLRDAKSIAGLLYYMRYVARV